jgi:hypothetical protein
MALTKAAEQTKSLVSDSYLRVTGLPIESPPASAMAEFQLSAMTVAIAAGCRKQPLAD